MPAESIINKIQIYQYNATTHILAYIVKAFKSRGGCIAIILFYTPILNGDELQFLGMAKRNPKSNLAPEKLSLTGRVPNLKDKTSTSSW